MHLLNRFWFREIHNHLTQPIAFLFCQSKTVERCRLGNHIAYTLPIDCGLPHSKPRPSIPSIHLPAREKKCEAIDLFSRAKFISLRLFMHGGAIASGHRWEQKLSIFQSKTRSIRLYVFGVCAAASDER